MPDKKADLEIYAQDQQFISICVVKKATFELIESKINRQFPPTQGTRWMVSGNTTFEDGQPHPFQCPTEESRHHLLIVLKTAGG